MTISLLNRTASGCELQVEPVHGVYVYANYKHFEPEIDLAPTVEMLLRYVPTEYLAGLKDIEITNAGGDRATRRRKTWHRGKKYRLVECLGLYHRDHVTLLVDNMIRCFPMFLWRRRLIKPLIVGWVLYHEIGHHIHLVHRPEYREPENVADSWRDVLMRRYVRRRYKYTRRLFWLYFAFPWSSFPDNEQPHTSSTGDAIALHPPVRFV